VVKVNDTMTPSSNRDKPIWQNQTAGFPRIAKQRDDVSAVKKKNFDGGMPHSP